MDESSAAVVVRFMAVRSLSVRVVPESVAFVCAAGRPGWPLTGRSREIHGLDIESHDCQKTIQNTQRRG